MGDSLNDPILYVDISIKRMVIVHHLPSLDQHTGLKHPLHHTDQCIQITVIIVIITDRQEDPITTNTTSIPTTNTTNSMTSRLV